VRPAWSGTISFGLVGIPVKAVTAQTPKEIRFHLLHRTCHTRLVTKRYCPKCKQDVAEDETVRGFPYAKGDYVMVESGEMDDLNPAARHTIQILDFVSMEQVDPVYFEKPYYLQPGEGGDRVYVLLHRAMTESGRVGIGRVTLREREHLALIRPMEHALVMETIAFPDEVRALESVVPAIDAKVDNRELQMAHMLVDALTAEFEPGKYQDEYRAALTELIEKKADTGAPAGKGRARRPAKGEIVDLMEVLRRSMSAVKEERAPGEKAAPRPAARSGGRKQKAA
jgi:DNA end-binding protein Ku